MHLYQKLLSLEMTLILKSFQSPSEKSCTRNRGERDNSLRAFCNRRSLIKLSVKILIQSLWMQVILQRICFTDWLSEMLEISALIILFKDIWF